MRPLARCLALAWLCLTLAAAGALAAGPPRASLTSIERQVMCVTCKIPLNVAESPQAARERAFIQELIDEGRDEAQIKHALVGQYGTTVLALPPASGFDLTVYLVPVAVVAVLLALLAALLVRWRRRGRQPATTPEQVGPLSAGDASRLEADLSRFD
jgi:cytochrome c-type biogenesis protein CcmH